MVYDTIAEILYLYDRVCPECRGSLTRVPRKFIWVCKNSKCKVDIVKYNMRDKITSITYKKVKKEWKVKSPEPPEEEPIWMW